MIASVEEIMNDFENICSDAIDGVANQLTVETRELLGTQAPLESIGGKSLRFGASGTAYVAGTPLFRSVRAATPATEGAPPRRVTGHLQASTSMIRMSKLERRIGPSAWYGSQLEQMQNHRFLTVVQERFHYTGETRKAGVPFTGLGT